MMKQAMPEINKAATPVAIGSVIKMNAKPECHKINISR